MAARTLKVRHQDDIRRKIKASQLANRLSDHAFGKVELSQTQVRAIEILLKKCVADLSQVDGPAEDGSHTLNINVRQVSEDGD
jgi:hypothetical protein